MSVRTSKPALLPPGLHVAPFLSREGALVLIALDYGSELRYMVSVTAAEGAVTLEQPFNGRKRVVDAARHFVPNAEGAVSAADYMSNRLTAGVHLAPWTVDTVRNQWIAIDAGGRLVAMMRGDTAPRELSTLADS